MRALVLLAIFATAQAPPPEALSGGATTVFDDTRDAFSFPAANLDRSHRAAFFVGNSLFNQNWIAAPGSVTSRDGLGPLFNARSCSGCHFKDGRGRPAEPNQDTAGMLVRISVPGEGAHGAPRPHPVYGDQIQDRAVPAVAPEARVVTEYAAVPGRYGDGTAFELRRPHHRLAALAYGPVPRGLRLSARVAPAMIGLGLLEAVPEETLRKLADPDDRDGDGISGRLNRVWDLAADAPAVGRFGWKAEQPSVRQQAAAAFAGDMGITSTLVSAENHTAAERGCARQPNGGTPEISDDRLAEVVLYARTLGVPARRHLEAARHGEQLFSRLGCGRCHLPTLKTGAAELPELAHQTIHPYTDLLLHDLGPELSDHRPSFAAGGDEWRTPPLWGMGLVPKVNGHALLLHDGRARGPAEAILWHGGEAAAARAAFVALPAADRGALVAFLESL